MDGEVRVVEVVVKRNPQVQAMYWDGTAESADAIIKWLSNRGARVRYYAPYDDLPGDIWVDSPAGGHLHFEENGWVIWDPDDGEVSRVSQAVFWKQYRRESEDPPVVPLPLPRAERRRAWWRRWKRAITGTGRGLLILITMSLVVSVLAKFEEV